MTKKICRFTTEKTAPASFGLLDGNWVLPLAAVTPYSDLSTTPERVPLEAVRLVAPINPSKIVCVGRNYVEHAAELGNKMPDEPLIFLKPPSSVIGPGDNIVIPRQSNQVEHEGEIGVVIGRTATCLTEEDNPEDYILGFTCLNDVTARDLQRKDVQFTRGKSFDTFCPIGPVIATGLNYRELTVTTSVNGTIKQSGAALDMAFPIDYLVRFISNIMTLQPGDVIATGTPAGVSKMSAGDHVEIEVAGVGKLGNTVIDARY
jgi:2-keto-4-pentenoate hydratase/2-oxohepta-3-ene-1,7-dioic acid hydratase in catechol pathway